MVLYISVWTTVVDKPTPDSVAKKQTEHQSSTTPLLEYIACIQQYYQKIY